MTFKTAWGKNWHTEGRRGTQVAVTRGESAAPRRSLRISCDRILGWLHYSRLSLKTGIALTLPTLPSPAGSPAGEGTLEAASRPVNAFSNKPNWTAPLCRMPAFIRTSCKHRHCICHRRACPGGAVTDSYNGLDLRRQFLRCRVRLADAGHRAK
jgi:hypothetical protein